MVFKPIVKEKKLLHFQLTKSNQDRNTKLKYNQFGLEINYIDQHFEINNEKRHLLQIYQVMSKQTKY